MNVIKNISGNMMLTILIVSSAFSVFSSCANTELNISDKSDYEDVFFAELTSCDSTKTILDCDFKLSWSTADSISVFRSSVNEKYVFNGKEGEANGSFTKAKMEQITPSLSSNYALFPFFDGASMSDEGVFSIYLQGVHRCGKSGSYNNGVIPMAAITDNIDDKMLHFKNICGLLFLKVYGGDTVRYITFGGNQNEKIAGDAVISFTEEGIPSVEMLQSSTTTVVLDCGEEGVITSSSPSEPTGFVIPIPPTEFENGFTVTIENLSGQTSVYSTSKKFEIKRNWVTPMAPVIMNKNLSNAVTSLSVSAEGNTYQATVIDTNIFVSIPPEIDLSASSVSFNHNGKTAFLNGSVLTSSTFNYDFSDFAQPARIGIEAYNGQLQTSYVYIIDLPAVYIDTPEKSVIIRESWTRDARLYIKNQDGSITDFGGTSIKGAGNGSWMNPYFTKKSYSIKFDITPQKQSPSKDVLGMPGHKNWRLHPIFRSYFADMLGFEATRRASPDQWSPHGQYVELILDGKMLGTYLLCENIKTGEHRINIKQLTSDDVSESVISGGYLLCFDQGIDEKYYFYSSKYNFPISIKSPDEDDINTTQFNYIKDYINDFESVLMDTVRVQRGEYRDYIDIDSHINYWFANELSGGTELEKPRSVYMYKDRGGKIMSGPSWDFGASSFSNQTLLFDKALWRDRMILDPVYVDRVKSSWPIFRARIEGNGQYTALLSYLDSLDHVVHRSTIRDRYLYPRGYTNAAEQVNTITNGLPGKLNYLEAYINSLVVNYDDKSGGNEDYDGQNDDTGGFNFQF